VGTARLTYAGDWTQTAGTLSVASGGTMAFTGAADRVSGTLTGAGAIVFAGGSDTLAAVTLSAAAMGINGATVTLQGAVTLSTTLAATTANLIVAAGGATLSGGGDLVLTNNAANSLHGASASARLVNLGDTIRGAGQLGGGQMILVNQAAGIIDGDDATALVIDTGANTIGNAGLIEATAAGGVIIQSAIANTGTLAAWGGNLTINGAVSGAGVVKINAATADFTAAFTENVTFGAKGVLELTDSQAYAGTITGFSKTGTTSLDLGDIAFGTTTKATYSGTTTSGVLTVTDGTHTAKIKLAGNYTASAFTVSSDGHGGTTVVDPTTATSSTHAFIAAMASFAGAGGPVTASSEAWRVAGPMLATVR